MYHNSVTKLSWAITSDQHSSPSDALLDASKGLILLAVIIAIAMAVLFFWPKPATSTNRKQI